MRRLRALAAALALATGPGSAAEPPALRELAWTAAPTAASLSRSPGECLATAGAGPDVRAGRALFASPALLGGPAARLGLSCDSCHADGRINRDFHLPELSGAPGTADVTSEWASKVRGDGVFNPRPIPDLAGAAGRTSFGASREPSLRSFVRGVIVEEFQGSEPSDATLDALTAYIAALSPQACAGPRRAALGLDAQRVREAVAAADEAADEAFARALRLAARDRIGRIVERLQGPRFANARRTLATLAAALAEPVDAAAWRARFDREIAVLARRERLSLYDERRLAAALKAADP